MIEKIKCIYHIIVDKEYAVYTIKRKNGKLVKGKFACYISDNASSLFLNCILKLTSKHIEDNRK